MSFLREIERNVPHGLDVHLIIDNYATRKTEPIRKWLGSRPRWHLHFTLTASPWVNQVERFFFDITERQIRRGVHRSTAELDAAVRAYIDAVNADQSPSVRLRRILAKSARLFCIPPWKQGRIAAAYSPGSRDAPEF